MKILILFSHPWRGGRSGGAETHALQLMKELALRGHEIYFVASGGNGGAEAKPPGVVAQYRLPFQSLNPLDKIKAYHQLLGIVQRHAIEIVHAHHRTGGYFAECIFRQRGVPYVVTVHDVWHSAPAKALHGRVFRHLIAVSGFIQKGLEKHFGVPPERIRVIHNGVDPERMASASGAESAAFRRKFGIGNEVVFSLVARVTRAKGHYDLVEALRLLPRSLNYKCLIVGEGTERKKLQKLVARYTLNDKLVFCGFQSNIPAVMRASDVILLPSHHEPFGLTIVEGMLAGKAVLAANTGGIPEIVTHHRDGLLFAVRDPAALAAGIELLTSEEGLRRRLGEEARRTAHRRFLLAKMIGETEACYASIVESTRAERGGTGAVAASRSRD